MTRKRLLLLGSRGKMGTALAEALAGTCELIPKCSADFDAADFGAARLLVKSERPDLVVNTVAFLGIDPCEKDPGLALRLNSLFPRLLAELAEEEGFTLAHFSTDAVFDDAKGGFYTEDDTPRPLNLYGLTKYGGDCFVRAACAKHYIFRLPVLFGESARNTQFVEKMLAKAGQGAGPLRVSGDIFSSPTYSLDAARAVAEILGAERPFGLYHVANEGKASLFDLMSAIAAELRLGAAVEKASFRDFPFTGTKNTNTPLASAKGVRLRPWREAVKEYCARLKKQKEAK